MHMQKVGSNDAPPIGVSSFSNMIGIMAVKVFWLYKVFE